MLQKKFSRDPKIKLFSLNEILENNDYFLSSKYKELIKFEKPERGIYYKITPQYIVVLNYVETTINYGMDISEKLDSIQVAYRDGITEYTLINEKKLKLLNEKTFVDNNRKINKLIKNVEKLKELFEKVHYCKETITNYNDFEEYLIDVNYKTDFFDLSNKYVVIDVETNGTRKSNDDLLSISIYDPTKGKCYNRFLPLDMQPIVLTSWVHGIDDEDLCKASHLTQEELDKVIDYFDLKNKILLSFSGGKGTFDSEFIINYCKRHNLYGFENLKYENIKSLFPNGTLGLEGQLSKDNLCRLLKIDGVNNIHTGVNDCILEWKLYEKMKTEPLFFINNNLFKYHDGYIVPVTYLSRYPELIRFANIKVPYIVGKPKIVFNYSLPKEILNIIKKFPTNITGISLEHGINTILNVDKQENFWFLAENKQKLEFIGSLDNKITEIPVVEQKDGTMMSLDSKYNEYVNEVNIVTKKVTESLHPVFNFIKNDIFLQGKIKSQEIVISDDRKVLAVCDLSDDFNILEIKTYKIRDFDLTNGPLAKQLYYEGKGRKKYVLSIDFDGYRNNKCEFITDAVNIVIYEIVLEINNPKPIYVIRTLQEEEKEVLKMIQKNPNIFNNEIAKKLKRTPNSVGKIIKELVRWQYIIKEDENKFKSKWIVLRKPEDDKTKFSYFEGKITIIHEEKINN